MLGNYGIFREMGFQLHNTSIKLLIINGRYAYTRKEQRKYWIMDLFFVSLIKSKIKDGTNILFLTNT